MSQMLNNYFSSVFTRDPVNFNWDLLQVEHIYKGDQQNKLLGVIIGEDLVHKKLVGLVANKAPGVDGSVSNVFIITADIVSACLYTLSFKDL